MEIEAKASDERTNANTGITWMEIGDLHSRPIDPKLLQHEDKGFVDDGIQ